MPPWPNFPPWHCLDSQLPSNTELSLLCHNDESVQTLRLRTTCSYVIPKANWQNMLTYLKHTADLSHGISFYQLLCGTKSYVMTMICHLGA